MNNCIGVSSYKGSDSHKDQLQDMLPKKNGTDRQKEGREGYESDEGNSKSDKDGVLAALTYQVKRLTLNLHAEYWRYITRKGKQPMALKESSSIWDVYLKWCEYQLEKHDKDDFTGVEEHPQPPITASELDVFKNFTDLEQTQGLVLKNSKTARLWPMRLSSKIINKLRGLDLDRQLPLLKAIWTLQLGNMADAKVLETGPVMYLAGFCKLIKNDKAIVFAVVPERVPVVTTVLEKRHISSFKYRQYLRVIDVVPAADKQQAFRAYSNFVDHLKDDPDKWNPFVPAAFLEAGLRADSNFQLLDLKNIVSITRNCFDNVAYMPSLDTTYKLSTAELRSFSLAGMRWVSELESSKLAFKVQPTLRNVNKEIIEKCTTEESCAWLLDFLMRIPNFNLRLTPQEQRLITTPGNVLCIGRSGTGKTTSAVLRLFALEILFKIRSTLFYKRGESLKTAFTAEEAESTTGLHSVIVTASPVLTNEIRRFYTGLKTKVISELRKREERKHLRPTEPEELIAEEETKEEQEEDLAEDEVLDFEEMEKTMKLPQSMSAMRNEDFPAFLTVKRLVYMIDASVRRPFFARNLKNEIIGLDAQAEWHNEQKGVLMINNYHKAGASSSEDDIERFMHLSSSDESSGSEEEPNEQVKQEHVVQEFAQEVDYELFLLKFWPKHGRQGGLSPHVVWTEIYSRIKGSQHSSGYAAKALPRNIYLEMNKEGAPVYQLFTKYEAWKREIKGFDFMDLVNHVLRELQGISYRSTPIHFMLVDEVQDLTPAALKLLLKVTEQNVYFAGDTAQTIAKGVGFRFSDLKQLLNLNEFQTPKLMQLTVNFRSHNNILTLANSLISALELFFPSTIDKLRKERSEVVGLKPIVLNVVESLFYVLKGSGRSKAEFGCDQVIIVRDQAAKKRVPTFLQHALCLTVYECKGLEFEDVVLFNFFNDAPDALLDQWKLLNLLEVEKRPKASDPDLVDLDFPEEETTTNEEIHATGEYEDRIFFSGRTRGDFLKDFGSLCTDLKQLYVCVTRPKKRLIIYDEDASRREAVLKYWQKLDAVEVITQDKLASEEGLTEEHRQLFERPEGQQKGWRIQGVKMFKRRFYEQAMKCFEHSGDAELKQRALAYSLAEEASKLQAEADAQQYLLEDQYRTLPKPTRRSMKEEIAQLIAQAKALFHQAAAVFLEIGLKKQAAQCLFTAKEFKEAAALFEQISFYSQAGEAFFNLGDYTRAARLYSEGRMAPKAVECYKLMRNWDAILECVKSNQDEFTQAQREHIIRKYVPLALNGLYSAVTNEESDQDEPSDRPNEEEREVIQEAGSEEEDYYEEGKSEAVSLVQSETVIVKVPEEQEQVLQSSSLKKNLQEFVIVETESSFSLIASEREDFEHLSQYDPDDEFLKSSLGSIVSGQYKSRAGNSELSDYSIIDASVNSALQNPLLRELVQETVHIIRTKRDIYAEDILMTKIIHYVSQFSDDVKSYLGRLRSKDALLSAKQNSSELYDLDLDAVDEGFLSVLLDCLESFELYKLCLVVCNRYALTNRLGRYLVSIANKYSNLSLVCTQFVTMFHPSHREVQAQVSFIAHQALHSALELIDPKYLRIMDGKKIEESLGKYSFTGLYNHGFWKKLLYLMDYSSALTVASNFADFASFRLIYLAFTKEGMKVAESLDQQNIELAIRQDSFLFLGEDKGTHPATEAEAQAYRAALDSVLWSGQDSRLLKFPKLFSLSYKALQLTSKLSSLPDKQDQLQALVQQLSLRVNRIGLRQRVSPEDHNQFQEDCYIYDTVVAVFLLIVSAFKGTMNAQVHILSSLSPKMYQLYLKALNKCLKFIEQEELGLRTQKCLLSGLLSVLRVRVHNQCESLYDNWGDKVLIHYQSSLASSVNQEVEARNKRLADEIAAEVMHEPESKFNTKKEINREIKKRLKVRVQREAIQQMVEIVDLEANFISAPLSLVLSLIHKQVTSYIKHHSEKTIKDDQFQSSSLKAICFERKEDIDNMQTPFEMSERFERVIALYNNSLEAQRFVTKKKTLSRDAATRCFRQNSIPQEGTIEYQFYIEEQQQLKKELKQKEYMVQAGLMTEKELEIFKTKRNKSLLHKDAILYGQIQCSSTISLLAVLNFDCLKLDALATQNLLEMAYSNWELFVQSQHGVLDFALTSVALYVAADRYVHIMQILHQQLSSKSYKRKMLFCLLDAHIYKKCGNILQTAESLTSFVKLAVDNQVHLEHFFLISMLEMALVTILSMKEEFCLPYEHLKFLNHLLKANEEARKDFDDQVASYFTQEDYGEEDGYVPMVTLKLRNTFYSSPNTADEKKRVNAMLQDIAQILENLVTSLTSSKLLHVFLCVTALIVNEPNFCDESSKLIKSILKKLVSEGLLEEENFLANRTLSFDQKAKDFWDLAYNDQNSLLYQEGRTTQQSMWVKVIIESKDRHKIREDVAERQKKAEAFEAEELQKLQRLADLMKPVLARKCLNRKQTAHIKVEKMSLDDRLLIASGQHVQGYDQATAKANIAILKRLSNLSKFIRVVILNSKFENVIDLHYLLSQIDRIETELLPAVVQVPQEVSSLAPEEEPLISRIENLEQQIQIWSMNKQQPDLKGSQLRNQRIMKLKWKEQALKVRQKLLQKAAARKKNEAYAKKKMRLKGK